MALNLVTIPEADFGAGIDSQASPSSIAPGYIESATNADAFATGQVGKRRGYQGYAGNLPIRVEKVISTGTTLALQLDNAVDLSAYRSTPVVLYGRVKDSTGGDLSSTDSVHYYSSIDVNARVNFAPGTTSHTVLASSHGFSTTNIWTGVALSTDPESYSSSILQPNRISVDKTTRDVEVELTNGTASSVSTFIYVADRQAVAGETFVYSSTLVPGSNTFSIPQGTHNLASKQLLVKVLFDAGTSWDELSPDTVTINKSTGLVTVTANNGTGTSYPIRIILSDCPTANFKSSGIVPSSTTNVQIDLSVYTTRTPFVFLGAYVVSGSTATLVSPNSVSVDLSSQTLTVQFVDGGSGGGTLELYWQFASVTTNILRVTQSSAATYTTTDTQLTLWGLDHSEIYSPGASSHAGWTNHIDSYRSLSESRLVSGLGGNLLAARGRDEDSIAATYLLGAVNPRLQALVASDTVVGPTFWETGETPSRTRGYLTADGASSNLLEVSSVTYDSGNGWVRLDLSTPNLATFGTLSTIISTAVPRDLLTIADTSYRIHDGEFEVRQVTTGVNTISVWIDNPSVTSSDWDISGAGGTAGVFSDRVTLSTTSEFIEGDSISSDLFATTSSATCVTSSGAVLVLRDILTLEYFPTSLKLVGARTSSVVPVRDDLTGLVRGDMLSYTGLLRQLRVLHINNAGNISVTISAGTGDEATVTLGSGDTNALWAGQTILLAGGATYQGSFTVNTVVDETSFTIGTTNIVVDSAILVGNTLEIDEELAFADSTSDATEFDVETRWIPIEAPDTPYTLPPSTHFNYFSASSYTAQPILRSSMVKDSLILTDYEDAVLKFDGTNIYRAGLPRWQPHLFMSVDISAPTIVISTPSAATSGHVGNRVALTSASDIGVLKIGDIVRYSVDGVRYTIQDIQTVTGTAYIYLSTTPTVPTAAGTLTRVARFRYYFRLNAIDANNLIVASAVVGSDDMVAELSADASVRLKLVGLPVFDNYDFDRLEIQIYRTLESTLAPFYRVTTIPMSFNNKEGYIEYVDTANDTDLVDLDEVNTALAGNELGTTWSEPLRAKYVTAAGNSLILANIRDYPTIDIQLLKSRDTIPQADLLGQRFLFRRDDTDTGTVSNMIDRAAYEWRSTADSIAITAGTVAGSLFTISVVNTASPGDWVYLYSSVVGNRNLRLGGWWQVALATGVSITVGAIMTDTSAYGASDVDRAVFATSPGDIPVVLGIDGNYGMLNGNAFGSEEFRAMRKLGDAVNTSMRVVNKTLTGYTDFTPWLLAGAGNDFASGQLLLKHALVEDTTPEVVLPTFPSSCQYFVNSVKRSSGDQASAVTRVFPSRLLVSFPNFSEIFDAPTALKDLDSASAIDVNPDDGQEITAVIPFFGESAFGAALNSGVVVVFKTNSVYLIDLAAKAAGTNPVQRIESQGKGCTAPFSVAGTRNGIVFANETGVYRLTRQLTIDFVGRKYTGIFRDSVNKDLLALATGHNNPVLNQYKLSYVKAGDDSVTNSQVAVYNHTREYEAAVSYGQTNTGSWTTYDNHPATGWANLVADSFFATTSGRVFLVRNTNEDTDFRDDSGSVALTIVTRGNDFGDAGIRKLVKGIISHWEGDSSSGTALEVGVNLVDNFEATDAIHIRHNPESTGTGDTGTFKVDTILTTVNNAKAVYFQIKVTNSTKDENVILARIDWRVAGLKDKGITQAAQT